jgi:hypothetical protein
VALPWDNVKLQYSTTLLRTLTNPDQQGAATINDTIGNLAGAQAVSEFGITVGISYDPTQPTHNFAIYELVIFILQTWANKLGESAAKREELVYKRLERLAKTTARARITPTTSSPDQPTDDTRGGTISNPLPEFDVSKFDTTTPNDPMGGSESFPTPFPS